MKFVEKAFIVPVLSAEIPIISTERGARTAGAFCRRRLVGCMLTRSSTTDSRPDTAYVS